MSENLPFLPYARQTIEDDDVAAVESALRGDFLTTGPSVEAFEKAFAAETGAAEAVACNSGTAALHLAVLGLGLGPSDTVVVPSITFLATANVARMAGAEVIFADVDAETGLLTPETLEQGIMRAEEAGRNVSVAIPVHLNGQVCDMPELGDVCHSHGVTMVEDACHALGAPGIGAAAYSAAACFSTHPAKGITTGEGGVVTTSDTGLAAKMRQLRNHGMIRDPAEFVDKKLSFSGNVPNPWVYEMHEIGWNYRIPDILCALGLSQLKKLGRFFSRRLELVKRYDSLLAPLAPAVVPVLHGHRPHGWHLYPVLIDFEHIGITRSNLMGALRKAGIGTQVHYIPVHRQPYYRQRYGNTILPGADRYYARCLSLPFYPSMTDDDVDRVAKTLAELVSIND